MSNKTKLVRVSITMPESNLKRLKKRYSKKGDAEAVQALLAACGPAVSPEWEGYVARRSGRQIVPPDLYAEIVARHQQAKDAGVANPIGAVRDWVREELIKREIAIRHDQPSEAILYRIVRNQKAEAS